jgi:hypothetical protein
MLDHDGLIVSLITGDPVVAMGDATPNEAAKFAKVVTAYTTAFQTAELDERVARDRRMQRHSGFGRRRATRRTRLKLTLRSRGWQSKAKHWRERANLPIPLGVETNLIAIMVTRVLLTSDATMKKC